MIWRDELQSWCVAVLLAGAVYIALGYLARSMHATGTMSRQARRWRKIGAALVLLTAGVADVRFNLERGHISFAVATVLHTVMGVLFLLLVWWWWRDRQEEKAAREALVEKLHEEGRERVVPPMSAGKRVWRWVVNGYAICLVVAALYVLAHYLLERF